MILGTGGGGRRERRRNKGERGPERERRSTEETERGSTEERERKEVQRREREGKYSGERERERERERGSTEERERENESTEKKATQRDTDRKRERKRDRERERASVSVCLLGIFNMYFIYLPPKTPSKHPSHPLPHHLSSIILNVQFIILSSSSHTPSSPPSISANAFIIIHLIQLPSHPPPSSSSTSHTFLINIYLTHLHLQHLSRPPTFSICLSSIFLLNN